MPSSCPLRHPGPTSHGIYSGAGMRRRRPHLPTFLTLGFLITFHSLFHHNLVCRPKEFPVIRRLRRPGNPDSCIDKSLRSQLFVNAEIRIPRRRCLRRCRCMGNPLIGGLGMEFDEGSEPKECRQVGPARARECQINSGRGTRTF